MSGITVYATDDWEVARRGFRRRMRGNPDVAVILYSGEHPAMLSPAAARLTRRTAQP